MFFFIYFLFIPIIMSIFASIFKAYKCASNQLLLRNGNPAASCKKRRISNNNVITKQNN